MYVTKERKVSPLSGHPSAGPPRYNASTHADILARLSVYTVPSSAPSYTALVSHFLRPQSALPHTAVVIVLDWTLPWTFVEELHTWLTWIERWVLGDGARELEVTREENRERCVSIFSLLPI